MTTYEPRCPALHPGLPYSRCAREKGHGMLHCNASGNTWDYSSDLMDGGVTAALIDQEAEPDLRVDYEAMWWKAESEREKAEENVRAREEMINRLDARARKAETALADVHERDETVARLEEQLAEMTAHRDRCRDIATKWQVEANRVRGEAESHDCIRDAAVIETTRPMRAEDITISMCLRAANHFERHRSWEGALLAALAEPQRPEGAEDMADAIEAYDDHGAIEMYGFDALADHLATMGYRKTTTEREN